MENEIDLQVGRDYTDIFCVKSDGTTMKYLGEDWWRVTNRQMKTAGKVKSPEYTAFALSALKKEFEMHLLIEDNMVGEAGELLPEFAEALKVATSVKVWYCTRLYVLNAPMATSVEVYHSSRIKSIVASLADRVEIYGGCDSLVTFDSLMATKVKIWHCHKLKSITALKVTYLDICNCDCLEGITAPLTLSAKVDWCRALTALDVPTVMSLFVRGCPLLKMPRSVLT